jgi:hypothetical protein
LFHPKRPWQKFDKEQCRREYHQFGSSFGALQRRIEGMVELRVAKIIQDEVARLKQDIGFLAQVEI